VIGEKKTINIPVGDAYGPKNPEMLIENAKGPVSKRYGNRTRHSINDDDAAVRISR
jgi:FKBP-type peptidyl-prolyl cis-trans isomerase 2